MDLLAAMAAAHIIYSSVRPREMYATIAGFDDPDANFKPHIWPGVVSYPSETVVGGLAVSHSLSVHGSSTKHLRVASVVNLHFVRSSHTGSQCNKLIDDPASVRLTQ